MLAGLKQVPVRIHTISRAENPDAFKKLLVEMNGQRIKSPSVLVHESLIKIDPKTAHQKIVNDRKAKEQKRSLKSLSAIDPDNDGRRCEISEAKRPFLDAILRVLEEQRDYWPLFTADLARWADCNLRTVAVGPRATRVRTGSNS